jgi:Flp pilus assembly pilin Flp
LGHSLATVVIYNFPKVFLKSIGKLQVHVILAVYLRDWHAATAIEYALIVGGIAVAVLAIVYNVGDTLENFYDMIRAELFGCDDGSASETGRLRGKGHKCK